MVKLIFLFYFLHRTYHKPQTVYYFYQNYHEYTYNRSQFEIEPTYLSCKFFIYVYVHHVTTSSSCRRIALWLMSCIASYPTLLFTYLLLTYPPKLFSRFFNSCISGKMVVRLRHIQRIWVHKVWETTISIHVYIVW